MIQGFDSVEVACRAEVKLPVCAKAEDAMVGASSWDLSQQRVSISSLLSASVLEAELKVGVEVVTSTLEEWFARDCGAPPEWPPLPPARRPCSFQDVFWVCHDLLQWSQKCFFLKNVSFSIWGRIYHLTIKTLGIPFTSVLGDSV
jgi:hypothetical protein